MPVISDVLPIKNVKQFSCLRSEFNPSHWQKVTKFSPGFHSDLPLFRPKKCYHKNAGMFVIQGV